MIFIILPLIEKIFNTELKQDKDALKKLALIQNKIIQLSITDWKMNIFIFCSEASIEIESTYHGKPDARISGTLMNLINLFFRGTDNDNLHRYPIEFNGDIHTIETFKSIMSGIQIDWEDQLSRVVGDKLAYRISNFAGFVKEKTTITAKKIEEQVLEYLQIEGKNLPTKKEAEALYREIDVLKDSVNKLEEKLSSV